MVSALWKACSAGDLTAVQGLLADATTVDLEIRGQCPFAPYQNSTQCSSDHSGATPLIEAVRNGHVDVVKALLEKGADPNNGSSQGLPAQFTSDQAILELLDFAQNKISRAIPADGPGYTHDINGNPEQHYQYGPPPPGAYPYYPSINTAPPHLDAGVYYPQPPPQTAPEAVASGGVGNLPPPEVARFIPCRYFPACRYGASCLFAHPQQYYPGSLPPPPAQYVAPYEPMNVQYPPNYFPPPSFQPPNGVHPMTPMSPPAGPHPGHGHSPSDVILPVQQPFSPNAISPVPVPYGPMSPNLYSHHGQAPVPMIMSPLPPLQHQSPPNQSPPNMYNSVPAPPYVQHDGSSPYPVTHTSKSSMPPHELNGDAKHPQPQDAPGPNNHHPLPRDGAGHHRRGARRTSFNGRKPPCLFFPAGRCKNGDDCRFPHVLPDGNAPHNMPYYASRNGPRTRHPNTNGVAEINEKLSGLSVRDDAPVHQNGHDGTNRPQSMDSGRPRFHQGGKNGYVPNGTRPDKRPQAPKQRVPNADEFPVLAGSITPPTRSPGFNGMISNGNGHGGPTAAQVLQAPAPFRSKEGSKESSTRGTTPDPIVTAPKAEPNGVTHEIAPVTHKPVVKLPVSFAAVAAPDLPKEITLSA
ncbi:hypothetical protein H0H81_007474 [Sphagnurus paluster]|uniref:C3H1-type domain-containing protein n=1 Tax=Sphagnurus paluster TaxID=117069 RepID=A0A9P7KLJ0_9AGAR|nr:hypothetical protein H0H81_007474 [Sphagnurus paluster]